MQIDLVFANENYSGFAGFVYSMWVVAGNGSIKWAALISNVDNNRVENKRGREREKRKRKENKTRSGDHWCGLVLGL